MLASEKLEINISKNKLNLKERTTIIDHIKNEIPAEEEIISDNEGFNSFKIFDKREFDFEVTILLTCACNYSSFHKIFITDIC